MTHPPRNAAAELERLAAKLEAAEKDIALKEKIIDSLGAELNAAEKERDALRTEVSNLTISIESLSTLKKSYEKWVGTLQDERDELRSRIEEIEQ